MFDVGVEGRRAQRYVPFEEESDVELVESENEEESSEAELGSTIADESGVDILEVLYFWNNVV